MSAAATTHDHSHAGDHAHDHHEPSWLYKYIFSTDHKVIGVQYGVSGLLFLLFGFFLMMVMRWTIAYPGEPMPGLIPEDEPIVAEAQAMIEAAIAKL